MQVCLSDSRALARDSPGKHCLYLYPSQLSLGLPLISPGPCTLQGRGGMSPGTWVPVPSLQFPLHPLDLSLYVCL